MEKSKRIPVPEETRAKLFLWCARHCCFCGKACTTNMELHHIDEDSSNNDEDNLIPVCFDCHGELPRYNPKHPKGSKYRHLEIKKRRDQIYDLYTLPYVRQVDIKISKYFHHVKDNVERQWGDFSCTVKILSHDFPVKLRLRIEPYHNNQRLEVTLDEIYSGQALLNLNPSQIFFGHFKLPIQAENKPFLFRVEVFWSIVDILDREHKMLPFSYVWDNSNGDWWFDPRTKYNESGL